MDAPVVLRSTRRFVLLDASDEYRLIDRTAGEDAVETFPATEEGFDAAWQRFSKVVREERLSRGYPWLWMAIAGGTALWVVAGVASTAWFFGGLGPGGFGDISSRVFEIVVVLSEIGSRIAIGGLVLLAALVLRSRLAQQNGAALPTPVRQTPSPGETALRWSLVAGLLAWLVGKAGDVFFPPDSFLSPGGLIQVEGGRSQLWVAVESLGFTVWVGSFVLLILLWASRWWGTKEDFSPTPVT